MDKRTDGKVRGVSRRDFIKGMGAGALGSAVIPQLLGQEAIQTKRGRVPVYEKKQVALAVNGKPASLVVAPNETLLDVLRDRLGVTGPKKVCDHGQCGGCTVLLDGTPVYACMSLAIRADGRSVTTVEGLAKDGRLHPVQDAFIENDGYQCGFCTPGFLVTAAAFLDGDRNPAPGEIERALSGNLCRCGNYPKIHRAVAAAARRMKGA
jgi:xanthine dehydrogenase YagT iron-sulfur-binding subunit